MTWRWAVALLLLFGMGCASTRVVRLETRPEESLEDVSSSRDEQVEVNEDAFEQALAQLLLEVPLSVRPSEAGQQVLAVSAGEALDGSYRHALRREYGRWCETRESPGDCLSLLEDGLGFGRMERLKAAIAFAIDPVWEGVAKELRDTLQPELLHAMVVAALASYVALLAFPEPAVTKAGALLLTAWMVAYLGTGPFLVLTRACFTLKQATDRATTFAELETAGARFGTTLGHNGTRIAVMLVTAALGGGLAARGPTLPGFPLAARLAERQVGLRLLAAGEVRSITVAEGSLVVGLAPNAVAMATRDPRGDPGATAAKEPSSGLTRQTIEQLHKSKGSYEKLIREHRQKLAAYKQDPFAFDNKGTLRNAPEQLRPKIIEGRIRELERQIAKQEEELRKINALLGGGT